MLWNLTSQTIPGVMYFTYMYLSSDHVPIIRDIYLSVALPMNFADAPGQKYTETNLIICTIKFYMQSIIIEYEIWRSFSGGSWRKVSKSVKIILARISTRNLIYIQIVLKGRLRACFAFHTLGSAYNWKQFIKFLIII